MAIETQSGLEIEMGVSGIEITTGNGASVTLQGPKTSVGSALEVT